MHAYCIHGSGGEVEYKKEKYKQHKMVYIFLNEIIDNQELC